MLHARLAVTLLFAGALFGCSDDVSATGGGGSTSTSAGAHDQGGAAQGAGGSGASTSNGGSNEGGAPVEVALVHSVGRFDLTDPDAPTASWSGTSFRTRIDGTGVDVTLGGAANVWFEVVIDDVPTAQLVTDGGDATYVVADALPPGEHEIEIYRRNEGFAGAVSFLGFTPHDGRLVSTPSPYVHTMEFVGDSITCGYGDEGLPGCSFSADTESAYSTYAAVAARNVGAAAHLIAFSGKGMHKNCCGDTSELMPELYLRTLTDDAGATWDFSQFTPEVVVVNLGTNDFNSNVDPNGYVADYVTFLGLLRQNYPAATIVCVTWAIWGAANEQLVHDAIDQFADPDVLSIRFEWDTQGDGLGCDGHPNVTTHQKLGTALTEFLATELGW